MFGILTITGLSPLDVGQELPNPSSETFPSPEIYEGGKTCSGFLREGNSHFSTKGTRIEFSSFNKLLLEPRIR